MIWKYSGYPGILNGRLTLTSGTVEIQRTSTPRLPRISIGEGYVCILPKPLDIPYCKWKIVSDVSDDLERFIRGKYWFKIDTGLVAEYFAANGMPEAATAFDKLVGDLAAPRKFAPDPAFDEMLEKAIEQGAR